MRGCWAYTRTHGFCRMSGWICGTAQKKEEVGCKVEWSSDNK